MPAPDRNTPFRTEAFSIKVPNGIWGYYTADEVDTIVAGLATGGGAVDLSAYATTEYVDSTLADFAETLPAQTITVHAGDAPQPSSPTPKAIEDAFAAYEDGLHYFEGAGSLVTITRKPFQTTVVVNGAVRSVARIVKSEAGLPTPQNPSTLVQFDPDGKAMKLTSAEVNTAFGPPAMVDLFALPAGTVDLAGVAKVDDKDQLLVSKTVTAQAFAFGDTNPPRVGLTYTDTNQGYGERLVLAVGLTNEYLVYASDLDAVKSRVETLESKAAPVVDLAPYVTLETADATYGRKDALELLRNQTQTIFDSIYTRAEADARYASKATTYTKTECDAKFLTLVDVNGVYATKADLTAANPTAATSINDPALAAFKQSVMDEVKKMMAGGKVIPADVGWTNMLNAGSSTAFPPQAKVLNGVVYLRGEVVKSIGSGYIANVCQLPATIPPPPKEMVIPLACKNTSPAGRHYGYATFQVNRQIGVSCDNALNTIWLDGISYPAYE